MLLQKFSGSAAKLELKDLTVRRLCRRQSNEVTPIPEPDLLVTLELT